jgi:hypothetical protein
MKADENLHFHLLNSMIQQLCSQTVPSQQIKLLARSLMATIASFVALSFCLAEGTPISMPSCRKLWHLDCNKATNVEGTLAL